MPPGGTLRGITSAVDDVPFLPPTVVDLAVWVGEYYAAGPGEALSIAMPPSAREGRTAFRTEKLAEAVAGAETPALRGPKQREALALLRDKAEGLTLSELLRLGVGTSTVRSARDAWRRAPPRFRRRARSVRRERDDGRGRALDARRDAGARALAHARAGVGISTSGRSGGGQAVPHGAAARRHRQRQDGALSPSRGARHRRRQARARAGAGDRAHTGGDRRVPGALRLARGDPAQRARRRASGTISGSASAAATSTSSSARARPCSRRSKASA